MSGMQDWAHDRRRCKAAGAREIAVPRDGKLSDAARVLDVMNRKVMFDSAGIFLISGDPLNDFYDAGAEVVYIGRTNVPLGVRLRSARANRAPWTQADYTTWFVTMRTGDEDILGDLIEEYRPRYSKRFVRAVLPRKSVLETDLRALLVELDEYVIPAAKLERVIDKHFARVRPAAVQAP